MRQQSMRNGFSMITAIFLIIIMSTVAMLVFNLSGKMVKNTTTQYRHEQAALLARSYTEYALLQVLKHNRSSGTCIQTVNAVVNNIVPGSSSSSATSTNGGGYAIKVTVNYLGNGLPCSPSHILNTTTLTTEYNTTAAPDALAAVMIDVFVRYKDPAMVEAYRNDHGSAPTATQIPWITYHTRRLLKI